MNTYRNKVFYSSFKPKRFGFSNATKKDILDPDVFSPLNFQLPFNNSNETQPGTSTVAEPVNFFGFFKP